MHYFIDGYNLLFRTTYASEDLAFQRQQIILDLNKKIQVLNLDVTIVFDSQYHPGESERFHYNQLEIEFTNEGETADEFIINAVRKANHPQFHTVVTSDKRLAWQVRRRAGKSESVEEFTTWLNKRYKSRLKQAIKTEEIEKKSPLREPIAKRIEKEILPQSPPEECFDFYLEHFEKTFYAITSQANASAKEVTFSPQDTETIQRLRRKSRKKLKETSNVSEMERWLAIFEKKVHESK